MPSPDLIAPDRLEELLGGAFPEGEQEARLQGLARELRAEAPPAPPTLLERVREIGEQPPRRRRINLLPRRQVLALAALVLCLAAFAGLLSQVDAGDDDSADSAAAEVTVEAAAVEESADLAPPRPMEPESGGVELDGR
jgi:ferric-dicitrate binding protein FerR (iron transport regulator)